MNLQAIVLVGGAGTRLASVTDGAPKAMARVAGRPFLEHVLEQLGAQGVTRAILATGYRRDAIRAHFGAAFGPVELAYSEESTPLGTGGATWQALELAAPSPCFVLNGDTWVDLDYSAMLAHHLRLGADISIATHRVADAARFGSLETANGRITGFCEKGVAGSGLINAGIYLLAPDIRTRFEMPHAFSLESEFLSVHVADLTMQVWETAGRFIDIGIPADLERAQSLLGAPK